MDLYDDLPPTQEGNNNNNIISKGWAHPLINNSNNHNNNHKLNKNNKEEKKKNNNNTQHQTPQQSPQQAQQQASPQQQQPHQAPQQQLNINQSTIQIPLPSQTKFAPFKPRQTNKNTTISINISNISQQKPISNITMSLPSTETIIRKKITTSNINSDLNIDSNTELEESQNINEKENIDNGIRHTYECNDAYDPTKPNDYLKYCEERQEKKRQKIIEEENRRAIEETERIRQAVEKERAKAMEQGDIARVQATLIGSGRGRGRGVTNLPAWMTSGSSTNLNSNDINLSSNNNINNSNSNTTTNNNISNDQFNDSPNDNNYNNNNMNKRRQSFDWTQTTQGSSTTTLSSIILLKNMVTLNEIDSQLSHEISDECSNYGRVLDCKIKEINNPKLTENERVRVFVKFDSINSAKKAFEGMNGRYFAGRQIQAFYYSEDNYNYNEFDR